MTMATVDNSMTSGTSRKLGLGALSSDEFRLGNRSCIRRQVAKEAAASSVN